MSSLESTYFSTSSTNGASGMPRGFVCGSVLVGFFLVSYSGEGGKGMGVEGGSTWPTLCRTRVMLG